MRNATFNARARNHNGEITAMQKVGFMMKLKADRIEEYQKRHDEIWDEMREILKKAGRANYSLWYDAGNIFGYYEVEDKAASGQILSDSPIVRQWNHWMADLLETDEAGNPRIREMDLVFYLK